MSTRNDLYALIDQIPENQFEYIRQMLNVIINPPPPRPEVQRLQERGREYRKLVEQRFREARKPGTVSGMGGGSGIALDKDGAAYGHHSFHYWDDKALVYQTMYQFAGHQLEIMQRLSIPEDKTKLLYEQELSCEGRTVRRTEEFPFHGKGGRQ